MIRYFRELRLLPIAMVASACLLVLVAADLLLGRQTASISERDRLSVTGATVRHAGPGAARPVEQKRSWAQQMFNFPDPKGAPAEQPDLSFLPVIQPLGGDQNNDITGAVAEPGGEKSDKPKGEGNAAASKDAKEPAAKEPAANELAAKEPAAKEAAVKDAAANDPAAKEPKKEPKDPPPSPNGKVIPLNQPPAPSAAERAILERLQERRQELDKRARELDIREGLIADAEKRVDAKLAQIKEGQAQLAVAEQKKDEAEAARFKGLVTMYQTMKPRDAAKIFDHLEVNVLIEVASQINPRNMSEILAQMSPDRAELLTVELAKRAQGSAKDAAANLPKIEGRPTGQ
jgi:flagellar motility protein MotE (MotC chaperone)